MKYELNLEPESVGDAFEMNKLEDEAADSFGELEGNLDHECESCSEFDTELGETEWEDEIRKGQRMPMRPVGLRPVAYRRPGPSGKPKPRGNYQFHKPAGKSRRWPRGVITAPHVCTCPAPNCPRHGSEYVRWVQSSLNQTMNLRLAITGGMNTPTRSALRSFQQKHGLPVDGIAGLETKDALIGAKGGKAPSGVAPEPAEPRMNEPLTSATPSTAAELDFERETRAPLRRRHIGVYKPKVSKRSRQGYIKWVQASLNKALGLKLVTDGRMGTQTRNAIRSFQKKWV